ncbi:MAG: hypothetical protein ABIV10_03845, partial [Gemmatimonadaceae bacterium]
MLLALLGAGIARRGARSAHIGGERSAARHDADGRRARVRAVAIQPDACQHHLRVLLVETRIGAHFARHEAGDARFDAFVVL